MNWEPQHLPWKVPEPQIDGPASPDILAPRVLDASLALPESDLSKFSDRTPRQDAMQDIDELSYRDRIRLAFIRFDQIEVKSVGYGKERPFWSHADFLKEKMDRAGTKCSISDRERGYINEPGDLPDNLSYPKLCLETLKHFPYPPCHLRNDSDFSKWLSGWKAYFEKEYFVEGKVSPPSVKKYRVDKKKHWAWRDMDPIDQIKKWDGTPIGNLLDTTTTAGIHALGALEGLRMLLDGFELVIDADESAKGAECIEGKYYVLLNDLLISQKTDFDQDGPTGKNIVNCFSNANPLNLDLAEKQLNLLSGLDNTHKANNVLMKLDRLTARSPLYYLTSKCYEYTNK